MLMEHTFDSRERFSDKEKANAFYNHHTNESIHLLFVIQLSGRLR